MQFFSELLDVKMSSCVWRQEKRTSVKSECSWEQREQERCPLLWGFIKILVGLESDKYDRSEEICSITIDNVEWRENKKLLFKTLRILWQPKITFYHIVVKRLASKLWLSTNTAHKLQLGSRMFRIWSQTEVKPSIVNINNQLWWEYKKQVKLLKILWPHCDVIESTWCHWLMLKDCEVRPVTHGVGCENPTSKEEVMQRCNQERMSEKLWIPRPLSAQLWCKGWYEAVSGRFLFTPPHPSSPSVLDLDYLSQSYCSWF